MNTCLRSILCSIVSLSTIQATTTIAAQAGGVPFDDCGVLIDSGLSCGLPGSNVVFFDADGGGEYLVLDIGNHVVGDRLRVQGTLDAGCITTCPSGDGCIDGVTLSACDAGTDVCSGDGGNQIGCTDCPCGNDAPQGTVGGCLNSAGASTRLLPTGTESIASASLRFEASGVPPNNSAVLTSGDALAPANMMNPCFGLSSGVQSVSLDGLRCAVKGVLRHGVRPSDANGDIGVTTNGWGTPNGFFNFGAFASGDTKHFQIIHRDDPALVCQTGQNSSQAVSVTFAP